MITPYDSPQLDMILEALANQKRRGIVHYLSLQPATVSQLAKDHSLSLPAIHKHIRILEKAQLIVRKKVGRTNFVALNSKTLQLAKDWIGQYNTRFSSTSASLENYISRMRE
ncbi:MAG: transcriptional regulator [Candidatus Saccharibacteria bacterium]|nr:transcriptional regulator [Candidatus Saccharibacteria bacterium]